MYIFKQEHTCIECRKYVFLLMLVSLLIANKLALECVVGAEGC